jgi:molybdate transport system substrate-binding protein
MFHTGNVDLAFIAAAQLEGQQLSARRWPVPDELHAPIRQDVVLLQRASGNAAAREFLQFLRSSEARALIVAQGYRQFDE